jgi:DUF971 family protein
MKPLEIRREAERGLSITWSDKSVSFLPSSLLRTECPCAECREKRGDASHSAPLPTIPLERKKRSLKVVAHEEEKELSLEAIWPVGKYALGMKWGDGHHSGIYPFTFLKSLT